MRIKVKVQISKSITKDLQKTVQALISRHKAALNQLPRQHLQYQIQKSKVIQNINNQTQNQR
jgi:hypothetical protein